MLQAEAIGHAHGAHVQRFWGGMRWVHIRLERQQAQRRCRRVQLPGRIQRLQGLHPSRLIHFHLAVHQREGVVDGGMARGEGRSAS